MPIKWWLKLKQNILIIQKRSNLSYSFFVFVILFHNVILNHINRHSQAKSKNLILVSSFRAKSRNLHTSTDSLRSIRTVILSNVEESNPPFRQVVDCVIVWCHFCHYLWLPKLKRKAINKIIVATAAITVAMIAKILAGFVLEVGIDAIPKPKATTDKTRATKERIN